MGKNKKKRNKAYTGSDAADARPTIIRVAAVDRNKLSQWWFDRKRVLKPVLIAAGVVIIVIWLIVQLVRVIAG